MSEQQAKFRDVLNIYSFSCKLPGTGETIEFKPLTTGQLKKLLTYEGETNPIVQEQAIDEVIEASIVTEGFDPNSLYLEDRFFLLLQIRKKSKGEILEFTYDCKKCGSQTLSRVSLDSLPIIERKDVNPEVDLGNGIKVVLKHVTRADYKYINQNMFKNLSDLQATAEMQIMLHSLSIESVTTEQYGEETDLTLQDKKYLLENIPTNGYEKVKNWHDDNTFGIDFKYNIRCIKCGNTETIEIPLEGSFFF